MRIKMESTACENYIIEKEKGKASVI